MQEMSNKKTNIKTKITREVYQISSKSNNFLALIKDWKNSFRLTFAYKKRNDWNLAKINNKLIDIDPRNKCTQTSSKSNNFLTLKTGKTVLDWHVLIK